MLGSVEFRWIYEEVHHRNHHFVTFSQKVNCTFDLKVVNQNLQKYFIVYTALLMFYED